MGTEEKRQMRKKITIASLVFLVLVVAYLIYTIVSGNTNGTVFNIVVGAFFLIYWILLDILEPKLTGELENISPEQKNAFYKSVGLGFLGYAGLLYFLVGIGTNNTGIFGVIVYALTIGAKRRAREGYLGTGPEKNAAVSDLQEDAMENDYEKEASEESDPEEDKTTEENGIAEENGTTQENGIAEENGAAQENKTTQEDKITEED